MGVCCHFLSLGRASYEKVFNLAYVRHLACPLLSNFKQRRIVEVFMMETMIVLGSLVVLLGWLRAIEKRVEVRPQGSKASRQDGKRN